jgi:NAD(P)-dependent dehydrogenase (short-subunit alcohol dehydrogenase family)
VKSVEKLFVGRSAIVNYAASKSGVILMMKSIAQEVAPFRMEPHGSCVTHARTRRPTTTRAGLRHEHVQIRRGHEASILHA